MTPEFWAIIAVGAGLAGLFWRLDVRIGRLEARTETRFDAVHTGLATVKERLTAVETTLALLIKGLHIETKERA